MVSIGEHDSNTDELFYMYIPRSLWKEVISGLVHTADESESVILTSYLIFRKVTPNHVCMITCSFAYPTFFKKQHVGRNFTIYLQCINYRFSMQSEMID